MLSTERSTHFGGNHSRAAGTLSTSLSLSAISPKQIREGFLNALPSDNVLWEKEKLLLFSVPEKERAGESMGMEEHPRAFVVITEARGDDCFLLHTEAIRRRQETVEVGTRQVLPLTCPAWGTKQGERISAPIVGGFDKQMKKLQAFLTPLLCHRREKDCLFPQPLAPLAIVSGKHGAGKSTLIQSVLSHFTVSPSFVYHHTVHFDTLLHRNIHTLQRYLSELIQVARLNQPSILVLESIDAIVTTDQQGEYTLLAEQLCEFLVDILSELSDNRHRIAFLMTTNNVASLHKSLRFPHITQLQLDLGAPNQTQRMEVRTSSLALFLFETHDPGWVDL